MDRNRKVIRVVIADDSPTSRSLLAHLLGSDPGIRVVGEAADGAEAVELAVRLQPDVVTMDILMPRMNGVEATKEIMARAPTRIIIVTSAAREERVQLALDATKAGAVMVLGKPDHSDARLFEHQRAELLGMVRAMAEVKVVRQRKAGADGRSMREPRHLVRAVVMAASTGGPEAVRRILSELSPSFPVPILVVQHIARGFTAGLVAWLDGSSPLRVVLAAHGRPVEPGVVFVAPDDFHLGLGSDGRIVLSRASAIGNHRPSADHLFRSASHLGSGLVAVILTGMGRDGIRGLGDVKAAGGRVIAQDEATSVVYGMPREARAANVVDLVMPLHAIGRQLTQWCGENRG